MKKIYTLVSLCSCLLYSQEKIIGPGGVPGAVLWMQPVSHTEDWYGSYKWKDYSGDSLQVRYYDPRGASYGVEYLGKADNYLRNYNFNPALSFNTNDKDAIKNQLENISNFCNSDNEISKEIYIKGSNLTTATIIGAFSLRADPMDQPKNMFTFNGVPGNSFILSTDKIINSKESQRGILDYGAEEGYDFMYHSGKSPESDMNQFKERALRSFVYYRTGKPHTSLWGVRNHSVISLGHNFNPSNINNTSTFDLPGGDGDYAEAYIPELFIYGRILTPLERIKTESYLAVKYGFTLERSYLDSESHLIWDLDQDKKYSKRITGMIRDDKSGLFQKGGTTSYEENPSFSYSVAGDSYERQGKSVNASRYGLPNRNKLLVIERLSAHQSMKDKDYALWGDDNKGIETQTDERYLGLKLMKRSWLLNTNMGGRQPVPEQMKWRIENLDYEQKGYKISITKPGGSAGTGTLVSESPMPGYEGQIYFEVGQGSGPLLVKFGTPSIPEINNANDYGIYINEKGKIYPIIKGVLKSQDLWKLKATAGTQIRITKTKESIIISANGWALPQDGQELPQIFIDKEDIDKDFYVSIGAYNYKKDIQINNLRAEGFIDTGNRIELSYGKGRAEEFANYSQPTGSLSYLLIDRSGTGNFNPENTEIYPVDENDKDRTKIIFNNIFFDTDNNGKDAFTFAYRESNLIAKIEKENPSCDDLGASQKDGKITLKIERGDEGFQYQLYNIETTQIEKEGTFFGKEKYEIPGIPLGNYTLKLKEIGGFNLVPTTENIESKGNSQFYVNSSTSYGFLETHYKSEAQNYQMGFTPPVPGLPDIYVRNGIEITQGKIYKITDNIKKPTSIEGIQLSAGDFIQVQNTAPGIVEYKVNGTTVATDKFSDNIKQYYTVKLNDPGEGIYNIKHHKPHPWHLQGVQRQDLSESTIETPITLETNCKATIAPIIPTPQEEEDKANNLVLYYKDFTNKSSITAKIQLKESSTLTLAVFDFSGNLMYSKDISESKIEHQIELDTLPKGVYIVKVFTSEGEFTKKISIN
ncbi:T9SS type A sorting domain-containing protein [Apibacter adventoris]|uniref:T9SS type A sorting domain-containing protein n=2 Tax=Apibacter adventoris TaxID=1679466 RepID=UPI000CF69DFB|nr:T9SS type A sorting domain-containing protein [Apibacter adventoris]PQL93410.1 hypothetical protein C4S76_09275 [Apibacter adventoris]PQL93519.1 hypothetical protein C4S76_07695 [Apibacter adventoris]